MSAEALTHPMQYGNTSFGDNATAILGDNYGPVYINNSPVLTGDHARALVKKSLLDSLLLDRWNSRMRNVAYPQTNT